MKGEWSEVEAKVSGSRSRHPLTSVAVPDDRMVGRVGRVTGTIQPGRLGEVMIAIRGGSEAFHAYASDPKQTVSVGTRVVVLEYFPPRTVVVSTV